MMLLSLSLMFQVPSEYAYNTPRYHPDERKWWMTLVNDPNVWAVSNASMKSLIMGRKYGIY